MKRTLEHDRSEGFSAVEVLIAASIVAVALLAIATMFPIGYTNVAQSGKRTTAVNLAQQRIEWARNQLYASVVNATESNIPGYSGYTRTTTVTTNPDFDGDAVLDPDEKVKQVTVTVTTPVGQTVTVVSLLIE